MHEWLFARGGAFTDAELHAHLREEGYDVAQFTSVMMGDETLRLVQADIDEAMALGLQFTPMVFVNGIELEGIRTPGGLGRALNNVAATRPIARNSAGDKPPNATQKIVNDWRKQPPRALPVDTRAWWRGPAEAATTIVMWGDYQEPRTAEAAALVKKLAASRAGTRYTFRHYPINQECNAVASRTLHDETCTASQAAEAAGSLGGEEGFWKMHDWLLTNQRRWSGPDRLDSAVLQEAARACGLDGDALLTEMASPAVAQAINEDAAAGKTISLVGVPTIFVNGKQMRIWRDEGETVLRLVLEEAAKLAAAGR
jgi:protein-disulfide isomerase